MKASKRPYPLNLGRSLTEAWQVHRTSLWRGLGLALAVTFCAALSAQTFTRYTNELHFAQSDAGTAVWFDYDNDGWQDVLCAGGWEGGYGSRAFRNNRDGTFRELSETEFAGRGDRCFYATVADFDNDGFLDILGAGFLAPSTDLHPVFYRNRAGAGFSKLVLDASKIVDGIDARGTTVAVLDFDRDGWVDAALGRIANASQSYLLKNEAGVGFSTIRDTAWTTEAGLGAGECVSSIDYDGDGAPDLLGNGSATWLFRNTGDGAFERVPDSPLSSQQALTSLSSAWGDYDNDGDMDVVVTWVNQASVDLQLFLNDGTGHFTPGFSTTRLSQYVSCVDYDNDSRLDLFVTGYNTQCQLYRNIGGGDFEQILDEPLVQDLFGRFTMAGWSDFDNDGFMDVLVTASGSANGLYRNSGNGNHWLKVMLRGQVSNRAAIGAVIRVKATVGGQEVWQMRVVQAQSGYSETVPIFGLGDATVADVVRIEWPSGNVQELANQSVDRVMTVTEQTRITPLRPSGSLSSTVTLTLSGSGAVEWYHDGVLLGGEVDPQLTIANLSPEDAGRYSVVETLGGVTTTNHTALYVDTQFTKITEGPEVSDRGVSFAGWGDYDRDQYPDLIVGRYLTGLTQLYRNQSGQTFTTVLGILPDVVDAWLAPMIADFDNDEWPDLFVPVVNKPASLYYNEDGQSFTVNQPVTSSPWNISAADYNLDGRLDLYLTSAGSPRNRILENIGGRVFEEKLLADVGDLVRYATFGGGCWGDYDDDGWPDLFAPSMNENRGRLFRNEEGHFVGVANAVTETPQRALAGAWGDYDNDGDLDLVVACFGGESRVFRNVGGGQFEIAAITTINGQYNSASWADYDNDGYLDLFMTFGNATRNLLLRNNGDGAFIRARMGSLVGDRPVAGAGSYHGLWLDINNDGFLDLYVANGNDAGTAQAQNFRYQNNPNGNHWLQVRLTGTSSHPQGIGAKVRAEAAFGRRLPNLTLRRDITGGDIYNGNQLYAHFGLGMATNVSTLRIEWPSGIVQELKDVQPNQILKVTEPPRLIPQQAGGFRIQCWLNQSFDVESSTDLENWTLIDTVTNETGTLVFQDAEPMLGSHRYYRAVAQ